MVPFRSFSPFIVVDILSRYSDYIDQANFYMLLLKNANRKSLRHTLTPKMRPLTLS